MSKSKHLPDDLVRMSPRQRAEWVLERAQYGVETAAPGSVAYVQSLRSVARAGQELEELKTAEGDALDAANLSPDQWAEKVAQDAQQATDEDLEAYVSEWLNRVGYGLQVTGGELRLVRSS
tara:strand:+ start:41 stop:403 length:363 start_codon:yes stop_codon:yes gene_type:complete